MPPAIKIESVRPHYTQRFSDNLRKVLQVPIAVFGHWKHLIYGDVIFDQQKFDQMITNWENKVTGFEPPLFIGHPIDVTSFGGAPSVAFLERLYQVDTTLFGDFDPVDSHTYAEVAKGSYRYSSAEVLVNATNKLNNEDIGYLLTGCALTNTPFLTGMPRVRATETQLFSEPLENKSLIFSFLPPSEKSMDNLTATQVTTQAPTQVLAQPDKNPQVLALTDQLVKATMQLAEIQTQYAQMQTELARLNDEIKVQAARSDQERLNRLSIPAQQKEIYAQVLPHLPKEKVEEFWSKLELASTNMTTKITTPQGDVTAPSTTDPNPYAATIARNHQLYAEQATARQLALRQQQLQAAGQV